MNHHFIICNGDTDSIAFCKTTEKPFTDEEQASLLAEINSLMPAHIEWKNDKVYRRLIVFAAKNYVMDDGKTVKIKGSALKASKKEPRLKEFIREVIDLMLKDKKDQILFAYLKVCREIMELKDMTPWSFKVTVTKKVLDPQATFQKKIKAAIGSFPVSEGDKVHLFFREDGSLCRREEFNGECDRKVLLGKLRDTMEAFGKVIDVELFPDLTLKRNAELLESLTTYKQLPKLAISATFPPGGGAQSPNPALNGSFPHLITRF
jgi:hypothetical protein